MSYRKSLESLVVAASRDRAAVNDVAMRTVKVIYGSALDIGCFSHTLDHVGERLKTPQLDVLLKAWISLFAHRIVNDVLHLCCCCGRQFSI